MSHTKLNQSLILITIYSSMIIKEINIFKLLNTLWGKLSGELFVLVHLYHCNKTPERGCFMERGGFASHGSGSSRAWH
jgi:hypothetical protein